MASPEYDLPIAVTSGGARDITNHDPIRGFLNPSKHARVGIVGQVIAYFGDAHKHNNNNMLFGGQALEAMI